MTQKEKLLKKLSNPDSDGNWTMAEIVKLLADHGWVLNRVKGSHHIFGRKDNPQIVVAAHGNAIKKGYLREIRLNLLE